MIVFLVTEDKKLFEIEDAQTLKLEGYKYLRLVTHKSIGANRIYFTTVTEASCGLAIAHNYFKERAIKSAIEKLSKWKPKQIKLKVQQARKCRLELLKRH